MPDLSHFPVQGNIQRVWFPLGKPQGCCVPFQTLTVTPHIQHQGKLKSAFPAHQFIPVLFNFPSQLLHCPNFLSDCLCFLGYVRSTKAAAAIAQLRWTRCFISPSGQEDTAVAVAVLQLSAAPGSPHKPHSSPQEPGAICLSSPAWSQPPK